LPSSEPSYSWQVLKIEKPLPNWRGNYSKLWCFKVNPLCRVRVEVFLHLSLLDLMCGCTANVLTDMPSDVIYSVIHLFWLVLFWHPALWNLMSLIVVTLTETRNRSLCYLQVHA